VNLKYLTLFFFFFLQTGIINSNNAISFTYIQHPPQLSPTKELPTEFSAEIGRCSNLSLTKHYNALHFAKLQYQSPALRVKSRKSEQASQTLRYQTNKKITRSVFFSLRF